MISCNKGVCNIVGSIDEIRADIATLLHAIDMTLIEKIGKNESEKMIYEAFEIAMKYRNEDDLPKVKKEDINELLEGLKKILEVIKDGSTE